MKNVWIVSAVLLVFPVPAYAQEPAAAVVAQQQQDAPVQKMENISDSPRIITGYEKDDFEIINDESVITCFDEKQPEMAFCARKALFFEVHVDCVTPDIALTALDLETTKVMISSEYEPGSCEFEQILEKAEQEVHEQDADTEIFLDLKGQELQQKYAAMLESGERCVYIKREMWNTAFSLMKEFSVRDKIRRMEKGAEAMVLNKCRGPL